MNIFCSHIEHHKSWGASAFSFCWCCLLFIFFPILYKYNTSVFLYMTYFVRNVCVGAVLCPEPLWLKHKMSVRDGRSIATTWGFRAEYGYFPANKIERIYWLHRRSRRAAGGDAWARLQLLLLLLPSLHCKTVWKLELGGFKIGLVTGLLQKRRVTRVNRAASRVLLMSFIIIISLQYVVFCVCVCV